LIDAGWMAMPQDRGISKQDISQGYGVVCDSSGAPFHDLILAGAHQEHGIVTLRPGSTSVLSELAIGDRVPILPKHACATEAQHRRNQVVHGKSDIVADEWLRFFGLVTLAIVFHAHPSG
jgi:D-serine deaminase-like pyridoxal phosphate-dependent protein